jgi:hypothetical protein
LLSSTLFLHMVATEARDKEGKPIERKKKGGGG